MPETTTQAAPTRRRLVVVGTLLALAAASTALYATGAIPPMMADTPPKPVPAPIDGDRAYADLKAIVALGPRPAGSAANLRQQQLVAERFQKLGGAVRLQKFSSTDPLTGDPVQLANVVGSWFPDRPERVVIAAHYDTRPHADMETEMALKDDPFLGANDCASGVALLMEIARHLPTMSTPWGVDLVIFDAEELVYGRNADRNGYFLGSKEFSRLYASGRASGRVKSKYVAGILLDMIGGKDLNLDWEPYSRKLQPKLVREVWAVAKQLGATSFKDQEGKRAVTDDHLPMNEAKIPTIDIIDFDYAHWHRSTDVPANCDPKSLEEVGRVVTGWLSLPKPKKAR